jgi:hypothetical protein
VADFDTARGIRAILIDELDAGGGLLDLRLLELKSSKDWVRFAKTSPVLTVSDLAASEAERRVPTPALAVPKLAERNSKLL